MAPASAIDVSRAAADFILTRRSLLDVPFACRLARAARTVVQQNFAIAIAYNCIAVPLAIAGFVTPLFAAIAMSLSSIVVVANSMRLMWGNYGIRGSKQVELSSSGNHSPTAGPAVLEGALS